MWHSQLQHDFSVKGIYTMWLKCIKITTFAPVYQHCTTITAQTLHSIKETLCYEYINIGFKPNATQSGSCSTTVCAQGVLQCSMQINAWSCKKYVWAHAPRVPVETSWVIRGHRVHPLWKSWKKLTLVFAMLLVTGSQLQHYTMTF